MKVMFFLFLVTLLYFELFREGFDMPSIASIGGPSIGEYDYLKPLDTPTVLDTTTEAQFKKVWSETTAFYPEMDLEKNPETLKSLLAFATKEEFEYYSKNKKWPYGSYMTNYVKTNIDDIIKRMNKPTVTTKEQIQQLLSTRFIYAIFIAPVEVVKSPQPLSVEIFTGKKNADGSTGVKGLSSENLTKLKSVCSTI